MTNLIQLDSISKVYPMPGEDVHALKDVSLSIDAGEFCSIVGASGSGKTTLLYLLGMLSPPTSGQFQFRDTNVIGMNDIELSQIRSREIGFIFQSFHLLAQHSVLQNVLLSSRYDREGAKLSDLKEKAIHLLEKVGLAQRIGHKPGELSGGEMQRVAVARALLTGPSLILADEPTGNLDAANSDQIFDILEGLAAEGNTVILVTHDNQLAQRTPRQVQLKDGEVIHDLVATR